jgi:3-oxoadipate enol-lactonase
LFLPRPDGTVLYWTASGPTTGASRDLVMMHGLLQDLRTFDPLIPTFVDAGWRVIRFDARGHGRSTRGPGETRWADLEADALAVMSAAHVGESAVIGHDLGGAVALGLAVGDLPGAEPEFRAGLRALSLWAVDAAPMAPMASRLQQAVVSASRLVTIRPAILALEPLWMRRRSIDHDAPSGALQRRSATTLCTWGLAEMVDALTTRPDVRGRLANIGVPTQVLWGDRDRLLRPNAGSQLRDELGARGGAVADAAHLLHVDRPEFVAECVLGFLEAAWSGGSDLASAVTSSDIPEST